MGLRTKFHFSFRVFSLVLLEKKAYRTMTDAHVKQMYSVVAEVTDDIQLSYNEFSITSTSVVQHYRA